MLGSTLFRALSRGPNFEVFGSIRNSAWVQYFDSKLQANLSLEINLDEERSINASLSNLKPDFVINCVGVIKQRSISSDHLECLSINSILPHRLSKACENVGAKLIHFSTDCVFSGRSGLYKESDFADANDLYGRTKFLGEVVGKNSLTLRTSIIGHELNSKKSLIDWFLSQTSEVNGFSRAVFSGLPTIEIAQVITDYVIPNPSLSGLYHLSVEPITKFDLLNLVADIYGKDINIIPNDRVEIDRSLDSSQFRAVTGFRPKSWLELIKNMRKDYLMINKIGKH